MPCRYESLGTSGSLFSDLLNPGAWGQENWKIHASVWRGISTNALLSIPAKTGRSSFCVYPLFILRQSSIYLYCISVVNLFMIVIFCINKYFTASSFIQSVHSVGHFQNRAYLWIKPALTRFDLPQHLGCIGGNSTGKTMVRLTFTQNLRLQNSVNWCCHFRRFGDGWGEC